MLFGMRLIVHSIHLIDVSMLSGEKSFIFSRNFVFSPTIISGVRIGGVACCSERLRSSIGAGNCVKELLISFLRSASLFLATSSVILSLSKENSSIQDLSSSRSSGVVVESFIARSTS